MKGFFLLIVTFFILFGGIWISLEYGEPYKLKQADRQIYNERIQLAMVIHNELKEEKLEVPIPIILHLNCPAKRHMKRVAKEVQSSVRETGQDISDVDTWIKYLRLEKWKYEQVQNFISFFKEQYP